MTLPITPLLCPPERSTPWLQCLNNLNHEIAEEFAAPNAARACAELVFYEGVVHHPSGERLREALRCGVQERWPTPSPALGNDRQREDMCGNGPRLEES